MIFGSQLVGRHKVAVSPSTAALLADPNLFLGWQWIYSGLVVYQIEFVWVRNCPPLFRHERESILAHCVHVFILFSVRPRMIDCWSINRFP
ncbi:hypothetical protein BPSG_3028 [Bifidobacterium pseudolongum subsp. globosum]|nr:hypothetical protein BPSG_3028 [Bifidobacterium pseudolongum subsp. globosum]